MKIGNKNLWLKLIDKSYGFMYTRPKSTQEKRQWCKDRELFREYKFKLRGKRSSSSLPHPWDDKYISLVRYVNWNKRKVNWKLIRIKQYNCGVEKSGISLVS